ncbi:MAG: hypothetical protein JJ899_12900 [Alphaproteobacteria bacterium]|nr:hypothetical protein [Alphaproteobacteria bacterium]
MESAPSSRFLLILNQHKLVYLPEVPDAPDFRAFGATVHKFFNDKRDELIRNTVDLWRRQGERVTKAEVSRAIPKPKVTVVALTNRESVAAFVRRYSKLVSLQFQLVDPNQEIDGQETWRNLRAFKEQLASEKTVVSHRSREGLNKESATEQINDAASTGNQIVKLDGKDQEGNDLKGNNEAFSISHPIDEIPDNDEELANLMYSIYEGLKENGIITEDVAAEDVSDQIAEVISILEE